MNQKPVLSLGHQFLLIFIFAFITAFIYSNTLNAPFVFDDIGNITDNIYIRMTGIGLDQVKNILNSPSPRPLANLSFALNYYFHQYELPGYHIINILVHLFTGIFLFFFFRYTLELSKANSVSEDENGIERVRAKSLNVIMVSFFATLIWLVHPVHTGAVTYLVQRMTSMAAMFYMLAFVLYIKGRMSLLKIRVKNIQRKFQVVPCLWFFLSLISAGCALASKQNAASLPIFILLYEWFFFQDLKNLLSGKKIFWIAAAIIFFGVAAMIFLNDMTALVTRIYEHRDFNLPQRIMTEWRVVVYYISLFFFSQPGRLNLEHDYPLSYSLFDPYTTLFSLIALIGMAVFASLIARKERVISFCILWFMGNLVIESTIFGLEIIFEHRTYLPFIMVSLLASVICFRMIPNIKIAAAFLSGITLIFSVWTFQRNMDWRDDIHFYQNCISKSPNKARPYCNLGEILASRNQKEHAIAYFEKALTLKPDLPEALYNMGISMADQQRYTEAIDFYQKALNANPNSADTHYNLGLAFINIGKMAEAQEHFTETIYLSPKNVDAHINLGNIFSQTGRVSKAIDSYLIALQIDPDNALAHNNLGNTYARAGNFIKAIEQYANTLKRDPEVASAKVNLNNVLTVWAGRTNPEKVAEELDRLTNQYPRIAAFYYHLGNAIAKKRGREKAIKQYEAAIEIQADYTDALYSLAVAYADRGEYLQSISFFKKLMAINPDDSRFDYNIACLYARQGMAEDAIKWLQLAVGKGYNNWEQIKTDSDLESIRDSRYFQTLVEGRH